MSLFEYVAVIFAVVVGLGLTRMLEGLLALVKGQLQFWWLFWSSRDATSWDFFSFLVLLAQPMLLYLLAGLITPEVATPTPSACRPGPI
jgi:hypothetical protein